MSLLLWAFIIASIMVVVAIFVHRQDRMHRRAHYVNIPALAARTLAGRTRASQVRSKTNAWWVVVSGDHLKVGLGLGHGRILTPIERLQAQKPPEGESVIERKVVSMSSAKPPVQRSH